MNPRPKAYESSALPLSYSGNPGEIIMRTSVRLSNGMIPRLFQCAHLDTTTHRERLVNRNAGFIRQRPMRLIALPDKSGVPVVVSRCTLFRFNRDNRGDAFYATPMPCSRCAPVSDISASTPIHASPCQPPQPILAGRPVAAVFLSPEFLCP